MNATLTRRGMIGWLALRQRRELLSHLDGTAKAAKAENEIYRGGHIP